MILTCRWQHRQWTPGPPFLREPGPLRARLDLLYDIPQVQPLATRVSKRHDREVRVDLGNLLEPFRTRATRRDGVQVVLRRCRYQYTAPKHGRLA